MGTNLLVVAAAIALVTIAIRRWRRGVHSDRLRERDGAPRVLFSRNDVPRYRTIVQTCKVAAVIAVITIPMWRLSAGPQPAIEVWGPVAVIIEFVAFTAFLILVGTGGLLIQFWLIERYGDPL